MKFDWLVKHNGIYYKAGEEVPMGVDSPKGISAEPTTVVEETEKKERKRRTSTKG